MSENTTLSAQKEEIVEYSARDLFGHLMPRMVDITGANLSDVENVLNKITDNKSWINEWKKMGINYEKIGDEADNSGNFVTAKNAYSLASSYYFWAQNLHYKDDNIKREIYDKVVACKIKVGKYFNPPLEKIEIPFGETSLPAYLQMPPDVKNPPCVIILWAGDSNKEETFITAEMLKERGLASLAVDGPGMGESRLRGLLFSIESFFKGVTSVIDYLENRPEINQDRIGILSLCFSANFGLRAAASDKRIKACVVNSGNYDFHEIVNTIPASWKELIPYMSGLDNWDAVLASGMKLTLEGIDEITSPFLVIHESVNPYVPVEQAYKIYDRLKGLKKDIKIIDGTGHCCYPSFSRAWPIVCDWLKNKLD